MSELDHVIMAIDQTGNGTVGCSCYIANEQVLLLMDDINEDVFDSLKLDLQPTTLLVPPRFDIIPVHNRYQTILRPSSDFNFDNALDKLSRPGGDYLQLSGSLNLESRVSIGCAGAVITHTQKMGFHVDRMEIFTLKDTMLLSKDALASLQCLSVFELFCRFAKTPQGRIRLRQMFLRPSLDIKVITERYDFVSIFLRAENQPTATKLSKTLSGIKSLPGVMTNLKRGRTPNWSTILDFCFHTVDIAEQLSEVAASSIPVETLLGLGKLIHNTIDLEETMEQNRTVIKRGINQDLDQVKDVYTGMESILSEVARQVGFNVVFLPQLGFHIVVPVDPPVYHDLDWETRFVTDQHVYVKNDKMKQMDSELGDLWAVICDTEIEIAHDLAQKVLQYEQLLIETSDYCGKLDSLLAYVHAAIQYKLVRPNMTEINSIDIKGGRHILQELTVDAFIPNDAYLVGGDTEGPTMIMMTGPNYSGKTIYQKQIALICYMAQIGSFVPADAATIGITDKILTRVNTCETVSKPQSAFMIDLQQISKAIKSCTNRSLIVIDEFGKGTNTSDGAGLASAVFQYFLKLGPKVLANTHFHEIFENDIFPTDRVTFSHMETLQQVVHLYNLKSGRSTLSYGIQCAEMNGIPKTIIDRAKELAKIKIQGQDLVQACSALPSTEMEELEQAEDIARKFLATNL